MIDSAENKYYNYSKRNSGVPFMKNKRVIIGVVIAVVLLAGVAFSLIYCLYPRPFREMLPSDVSGISVSVTEMGVRVSEAYSDSTEKEIGRAETYQNSEKKEYKKGDAALSDILDLLGHASVRLAVNGKTSEKYSGRYWNMLIETENGASYYLYGLGDTVCLDKFPSDGGGELYRLYDCEEFLDALFGIVTRD